jgi:hypothetical protein
VAGVAGTARVIARGDTRAAVVLLLPLLLGTARAGAAVTDDARGTTGDASRAIATGGITTRAGGCVGDEGLPGAALSTGARRTGGVGAEAASLATAVRAGGVDDAGRCAATPITGCVCAVANAPTSPSGGGGASPSSSLIVIDTIALGANSDEWPTVGTPDVVKAVAAVAAAAAALAMLGACIDRRIALWHNQCRLQPHTALFPTCQI